MPNINYIFALSLTIISIGYLIKKLNIVSEKDGKILAKIILNVTLPALIFTIVPNIELNSSLILLPLICIIYCTFVIMICFILFKNVPPEIKGLLLMCVIGFNIGLFAYPLIQGIWGKEGLQYIAIFDIGNAFIVFCLCYIIAAIYSPKNNSENIEIDLKTIGKSLLKSVPLLSYIIALLLNILNINLPSFIQDVAATLALANMALTLLLLGIFLNFSFNKEEWNNILRVLIIRYLFGISIGLLLFFILPFSILYRGVILVALILPIGMVIIPYAIEFEYDEKLVGSIVNFTIIISFILMWIIIFLLGI
ncbi:MAG: AEC family transporter [Promethearchaeota archaeon]